MNIWSALWLLVATVLIIHAFPAVDTLIICRRDNVAFQMTFSNSFACINTIIFFTQILLKYVPIGRIDNELPLL